MRADQESKLDRLMSGSPGPSVQEKEALLHDLLANRNERVGPAPRWVWARWSLAAGAAVMILLAIALFPNSSTEDDGFSTRGAADVASSFELACKPSPDDGGPGRRCPQGGLLAFRLVPPPGATHFSAAGLGPDSKLRYYFPSQATTSLPLEGDPLGSHGVVLGADHPVGTYRVFGCFTPEPIEPASLRLAIEARLAGQPSGLKLMEQGFEVIAP